MKRTVKPKDGPITNCPKCGAYGEFDGYHSEDPEGKIFIEARVCSRCDYSWDNVFKFTHTTIDDGHVPSPEEIMKGMAS